MTNTGRGNPGSREEVISTVCNSHCGGSCVLKVHIRDGVITRVETDDGPEPQLRGCLRGRAQRQRLYSPDRLRYPLKRVGPRGAGRFERISWDEALDTVAGEMKRVKETYGAEAMILVGGDGDQGMLHDNARRMARLMNMFGGFTETWGICSYEGGIFAEMATFGMVPLPNPRQDLYNSRLIILWGWNPAQTISFTNTCWHLARVKESGGKIVSVDPKHTETAAAFADRWIPIKPGTDAAMLIAMAYVMITENLHDQAFLNRYTYGFDTFEGYVLGKEDGVPKTPAWAESITGVSALAIADLAQEYATTKPAALLTGTGPGRSAYGEQYHRAAITLAAMAGSVGATGGSAGTRVYGPIVGPYVMGRLPKVPRNPVDNTPPPGSRLSIRSNFVYGRGAVDNNLLTDAIIRGKSGGYPADFKLLYMTISDYVNQRANTNRAIQAINRLEFIAIEEQFMTPTAKFADIILPTTSFFERSDFALGGATPLFYGYKKKVIEPLGESKPQLDIAVALAERLGIPDYLETPEDDIIRRLAEGSPIPDYEAFKEDAVFKFDWPEPWPPFSQQISDPEGNPFPTPSGKIEIYSSLIEEMGHPMCPPTPKYMESWESVNDTLSTKYPLQLITTHRRRRANSQFDNIPWLQETDPQAIEMNQIDAESRGIRDRDMVQVFNDRGTVLIPARVTERIMSGVVDLPEGAWYNPDPNGVDRGGCANVLTKDTTSPGGAFPCNTALVQVKKA